MEIIKKLIKYNFTPDINKPMYIVVHDTGNREAGTNAEMHFKYFNEADRQASAHFFVDSTQILQLIEVKDEAWHCGDGHGLYGISNTNSIGVEICINSDGDYSKALDNTKNLVLWLMKTYNIPINKVVRHYDASRKNCPQTMNDKGDWTAWTGFKRSVIGRSYNMENANTNTNVQQHWAQHAFDSLNAKGIVINETRFDSPVTRGEIFVLLDQIVKPTEASK